MRTMVAMSKAVILFMVVLACRTGLAEYEFENWNLEQAVRQAHLVMVARVVSIGRLTVVEGAKTDITLREYRFQPVRRLKGIFQRDQLSMTASDLGCVANDGVGAPPLKEGEFRLLILAQQQGPYSYGCVSAPSAPTTFNQRVPLLSGPDDPLVPVVETLINVADARSRRERAKLLVDQLQNAGGISAIPLLTSLGLRADWAADDPRAYAPLARLARDRSPAVRGDALEVLRSLLSRCAKLDDAQIMDAVADALHETLQSPDSITQMRLDALEGVSHLLALEHNISWAREWFNAQASEAATNAERTAAVTALAQIKHPQAVEAVLDALRRLPLDEDVKREKAYVAAASEVDRAGAERVLLERLKRSLAARQPIDAEARALGRMQSKESLPILLSAAGRTDLPQRDRYQVAEALELLRDERAVPLLITWLRGQELNGVALVALEKLDLPLAAREIRPLLKSERILAIKLRIARLLARHQIADGYALATEHLSDQEHLAAATLVLAALEDPRTSKDLSAIVAAHPDRRWHAAALAGLATIGDAAARKQLAEILADDRHPMAADAAEAAGLADDPTLLAPLANLVRSRNSQIAMSAIIALRRFFSGVRTAPLGLAAADIAAGNLGSGEFNYAEQDERKWEPPPVNVTSATRAMIAESIDAVVLDPYIEANVRREALTVARLLGGERYATLLSDLADQSQLEGTDLLDKVQTERRRLEQAKHQ